MPSWLFYRVLWGFSLLRVTGSLTGVEHTDLSLKAKLFLEIWMALKTHKETFYGWTWFFNQPTIIFSLPSLLPVAAGVTDCHTMRCHWEPPKKDGQRIKHSFKIHLKGTLKGARKVAQSRLTSAFIIQKFITLRQWDFPVAGALGGMPSFCRDLPSLPD